MEKTFLGHFLAFLTVAIWGSTFVFTKMLLLHGLSPAQIFTLRFIVAYLLLLAFELVSRRLSFRLFSASWRDELVMLLLDSLLKRSLIPILFNFKIFTISSFFKMEKYVK